MKMVLGVDIGSVTLSLAVVSADKKIVKTDYDFHYGDLPACIERIKKIYQEHHIFGVAATAATPKSVYADARYENSIALIESVKHSHPNISAILNVGGEKFGLIRFTADGSYAGHKTNTSCAAGTGSFLDQQAARLNLDGIIELSRIAYKNTGHTPKIASRCAVFAKTDLIHAQQEGFLLSEISDGLCQGLAKNIVDALFDEALPGGPILFCGGVAKNKAVKRHIQKLIGIDLTTDPNGQVMEAVGAAFHFIDDIANRTRTMRNRAKTPDVPPASTINISTSKPVAERLEYTPEPRKYHHPPLSLALSDFPDFQSHRRYEYQPASDPKAGCVEVDVYKKMKQGMLAAVYVGIDIGSTSTKLVLMDKTKAVLSGFYTRTAGRPVSAVCALFEAVEQFAEAENIRIRVVGTGTTGSGRKFVGRLIKADLIVDEITAHAKAAFRLNPEVDTIIEIGGQDAKFTTLNKGDVTFSIMNAVCAAGTGSFIEEQAKKLRCNLAEYAKRAMHVRAPLSSDRCTVFMERDINYYLNEGYTVEEVLASVLHSVRENYLRKVAVEGHIGNVVLFQGATAKNKALVAAFEQRLQQPLQVSRYCHLTGALGAALLTAEEIQTLSRFRGFSLHRKKIPIRSEVCDLCTNHCKLTIAELDGETTAYGFLCGRDYHTKRRINRKSGFDLIQSRGLVYKRLLSKQPAPPKSSPMIIGIPAGMYLFESLPFWRHFFDQLGIRTVTSEKCIAAMQLGKQVTGAEFCAPVTAMHGHVRYLQDKTDYIFLPAYIERRQKSRDTRRQFCYYSQFLPALSATIAPRSNAKLLTPVIHYLYTPFHAKIALYRMFKAIGHPHSFFEVANAYEKALIFETSLRNTYQDIYYHECREPSDIQVVLLGRPYSVLDPHMNKNIPALFTGLGIKTFYQDMIPPDANALRAIAPLLKEVHWNYGAGILETAEITARKTGLYPVLITSFKCAPDAFVKEYFQELMHAHGKPYLILELDEHDSNVGYETRIEAAIRSYRNHYKQERTHKNIDYKRINPVNAGRPHDKTVILPNWDPFTCRLLTANLQREGIDAHLMVETEASLRRSMRFNTGQCTPLNAVVQGFIEYIEQHDLDPSRTVLWMSAANTCSLRLYPHHIKTILNAYGHGMEKASVFAGEISFSDFSVRAAANAYFAYMFGGLLRKMGCSIRPYEKQAGQTDQAIETALQFFTDAFSGKKSKETALIDAISVFESIETHISKKPRVAIFGDLYVRDNPVMNQNIIHFIEQHGGEVITTPYLSYAKMVAKPYFKKWFREGLYLNLLSYRALLAAMHVREKAYYHYFEKILKTPDIDYNIPPETILEPYQIKIENTGESLDNILKVYYIQKNYPDVSLFVQTSPAFCCAALITEAMAQKIERITGVPVVSITYDSTGGQKNEAIIPYLKYPKNVKNDLNFNKRIM